jgi:hypothetical protein
MKPRVLMPFVLLLAFCASAGTAVLRRDVAPHAMAARTAAGEVMLEAELFRTTATDDKGEKQIVDLALLRDPANGLTFRTITSIGDRPFAGAQSIAAQDDVRFVEHGDRIFAFSVFADSIYIREQSDRYRSFRAAEKGAIQWLREHPEAANPNRIDLQRLVAFGSKVGGGFFSDPSTSQPKPVLLRDVARESDHWLVTIEGPSHRIVTFAINDHDQLVDFRNAQDPR